MPLVGRWPWEGVQIASRDANLKPCGFSRVCTGVGLTFKSFNLARYSGLPHTLVLNSRHSSHQKTVMDRALTFQRIQLSETQIISMCRTLAVYVPKSNLSNHGTKGIKRLCEAHTRPYGFKCSGFTAGRSRAQANGKWKF